MNLKDLITENDGKSLCPVRIVGIAGALQFFILTGMDYCHSQTFDMHGYGTALAAVIAAVGVAFASKSFQEGKTDGGQ